MLFVYYLQRISEFTFGENFRIDIYFSYLIGGAFYTPETIDTARLHYRNSWAPILHAVALWLNSTGFSASESTEETAAAMPNSQKRGTSIMLNQTPGTPPTTKSLPELNKDRMHLILGKSYEFRVQYQHVMLQNDMGVRKFVLFKPRNFKMHYLSGQ